MMQVMVRALWVVHASFLGTGYRTILPNIIMIAVLMIRPTGGFGQAMISCV
jgi:branched-subunit amino acid ABC-type transport system permease component